jgi:hypothetical protein
MNTITKSIMLTTAAVLLASAGPLGAAETIHHGKSQRHAHHHYVAAQHKSAVKYGNNTRDNSYGGVYGEYAPQPE